MGPIAATRACLSKPFTFTGRASRSEFWWFNIFLIFALVAIQAIDPWASVGFGSQIAPTLLLALIAAPACRRVHDTGRSGQQLAALVAVWMIAVFLFAQTLSAFADLREASKLMLLATTVVWALALVPTAMILGWLRGSSQPAPNRYGPNPHEVTQ